MYACTCILNMHTHKHIFINIDTHKYIYLYKYIHLHICTRTHTPADTYVDVYGHKPTGCYNKEAPKRSLSAKNTEV